MKCDKCNIPFSKQVLIIIDDVEYHSKMSCSKCGYEWNNKSVDYGSHRYKVGKYEGFSYSEVWEQDPDYFLWSSQNWKDYKEKDRMRSYKEQLKEEGKLDGDL